MSASPASPTLSSISPWRVWYCGSCGHRMGHQSDRQATNLDVSNFSMMPSVLPIFMFTLISLNLPSRAARAVHLQKKGELYTAPPFQFSLFQNHFVFLQTHCWLIANLGKSSDLGFYQEMLVESIFCSSRKVNFHQKMTMGSFMLGTVALKLMSEQNNGKIP